jgi:hypothetical protein
MRKSVKNSKSSWLPAVGLFFVAPLVAEFLLGNLSLKLLPALIVLAPMYGGGALLIREMVRGKQRGWRSILLLGAAYTLIEEGFVTQSLFNPDYLRMHMHLLDHAWIPALGIGAWWTLFMFNVHTFWSIAVSIALVEAVVPARATMPWLGAIGKSVVAVLFLAGLAANFHFTINQDHFFASQVQFLSTGVICLLLIVSAFLLPSQTPRRASGPVPHPWLTGAVAFILGLAVLLIPSGWNWRAVTAMLFVDFLFLSLMLALSGRTQWTPLHQLSLAAGGALAYGLHAFVETPVAGGSGMLARLGNVLFLVLAVALIAWGAKHSSFFMKQTGAIVSPPAE